MEKKPFNDVDDHHQKHIGTPSSYDMKQMPKPIRIIGYFMIGFMLIAAAFISVILILDNLLNVL